MRGRLIAVLIGALIYMTTPVAGAEAFAAFAFAQQWQADEERVPNYWGPLIAARDGEMEPYRGASGDRRLVQYFDTGRMELRAPGTPTVTIGRLAAEMTTGQIAIGDDAYEDRSPPAIEIAGDRGCACLTFATLAANRAVLDATPRRSRAPITLALRADGTAMAAPPQSPPTAATTVIAYDDATRHNVAAAFAEYRRDVGIETIGLALSEPFFTPITTNGALRTVIAQVFERRVLTYTATNPESLRVGSSKIGEHYYAWRYPGP